MFAALQQFVKFCLKRNVVIAYDHVPARIDDIRAVICDIDDNIGAVLGVE